MVWAASPLLLFFLAYRALGPDPRHTATSLPMLGVLLGILLVVYAARCVRLLRMRREDAGNWVGFLFLSLFVLCALLLSFTTVYRTVGLYPPASDAPVKSGAAVAKADGSPVCREPGPCLYFAVTTWTTVGYGDYTPTPAARTYAALEAMIGYLFMAFFIPTLIHATTTFGCPERD
jgi:hypothetical protein